MASCFASHWGAWIAKRRAAQQAELAGGRRARCEYGYPPDQPHLCGLPGVHKGAAAIGAVWTEGPCSQCDKGRPRWISAKEMARFHEDIRDGWRKPDGSICDLDLYQAAFARSTTPAVIAAERAQENN